MSLVKDSGLTFSTGAIERNSFSHVSHDLFTKTVSLALNLCMYLGDFH